MPVQSSSTSFIFPGKQIRYFSFVLLCSLLMISGCKSKPETGREEYAYVTAPQVALRDRVAAVFNKVGFAANGDKVRVLERSSNKRFAKVRTADGKEGWMEVRYLTTQEVYDAFAKLVRDYGNAPTQATAAARRIVNLHVQPARDAEALYQMKEGSKVQLLKRASTPKSGMKSLAKAKEEEAAREEKDKAAEEEELPAPPATKAKGGKSILPKSASGMKDAAPADPIEDWWLVRDENQHVGWLLGRMLDIEVPLEIAQYAEGQRIVASFVLNEVAQGTHKTIKKETKGAKGIRNEEPPPVPESADKKVPQYVVLLSEPKDGLAYDFNQLRVFTWNPNRSHYETAYRERMEGQLPLLVGKEDFGREGKLPTFTVRDRTREGGMEERKFKLNGVMVRRVAAPGEKKKGDTLRPKRTESKKDTAKKKKHH